MVTQRRWRWTCAVRSDQSAESVSMVPLGSFCMVRRAWCERGCETFDDGTRPAGEERVIEGQVGSGQRAE